MWNWFYRGAGASVPIGEMSNGYKNTLSMIGDIAYRMAVLNPMLGDKMLEETSGVVVIDKILT